MVLARLAARQKLGGWTDILGVWFPKQCPEKSGVDQDGKRAQSVKYMPCRYEALSSIPRNTYEKAGHKLVIPVLRKQRQVDPLGSLQAPVSQTRGTAPEQQHLRPRYMLAHIFVHVPI